MRHARELASIILMRRKNANVKVRIPIKSLSYKGSSELEKEIVQIVKDEVNVQDLRYKGTAEQFASDGEVDELTNSANQDLIMGQAREIIRSIQEERKKLGTTLDEKVNVSLPAWPKEYEEYIKQHALIDQLTKEDTLHVNKI